ncbi:Testis-expressed protein 11 [Polyrhizophydium stewartii]|uniref:Protein ZIP4 homolog n=1 Tax=Polyrhizophydium stewartii TaxID=2732419 RepID=A0ABR4N2M7_9FUNG
MPHAAALTADSAVRHAALVMIRHARNADADPASRVKLAEMHVKCAKAWIDAGDDARASAAVGDAAKLHDQLRSDLSSIQLAADKRARAVSLFEMHLVKAQLAWSKGQCSVSVFDVRQAVEPHILSYLRSADLEHLVTTAQRILKTSGKDSQASDHVALCNAVLDALDAVDTARAGKRLHRLKAYLEGGDWNAAENAAEAALQASPNDLSAHYLKMSAISRKSKGNSAEIDQLFEHALANCLPSAEMPPQGRLRIWVSMIHLLAAHAGTVLRIDAVLKLETAALQAMSHESDSVRDQMLLAKLHLLVGADMDAARAAAYARSALESHGPIEAESTTSRTCQMLLWRAGDSAADKHNWADALEWYSCSLGLIAENIADRRNSATLLRKIALCHLELGDTETALAECTRAHALEQESDGVLTNFLLFAIHIERLEPKKAISELCKIPVSGRLDLYIQAAGVAQKKEQQWAVREILKRIVSSSEIDWTLETTKTQVLTVLRCLIRLSKADIKTPQDAETVLGYSRKALAFASEVDWLFRTGWNAALDVARIEAVPELLAGGFFEFVEETARLARMQSLSLALGDEADVVRSLFVAFASQVSMLRGCAESEQNDIGHKASDLLARFDAVVADIQEADAAFKVATDKTAAQALHLAFELRMRQQSWDQAQAVIKASASSIFCSIECDGLPAVQKAQLVGAPIEIFERIADTALRIECPALCELREKCPPCRKPDIRVRAAVVVHAVKAALDEHMRRSAHMDVLRFSGWLRVLIRAAIASSAGERADACISLFGQALAVIEAAKMTTTPYPADEIRWLAVMAWNQACERAGGFGGDALRLGETALALAGHVDEALAARMRAGLPVLAAAGAAQ